MEHEFEMLEAEYRKDVAQILAEAVVAITGICALGMCLAVYLVP